MIYPGSQQTFDIILNGNVFAFTVLGWHTRPKVSDAGSEFCLNKHPNNSFHEVVASCLEPKQASSGQNLECELCDTPASQIQLLPNSVEDAKDFYHHKSAKQIPGKLVTRYQINISAA